MIKLPILQPLPIETVGKPFFSKIYAWIFQEREWEVKEDYYFFVESLKITLKIPKGFVFDGASIPRIFWGIVSPTDILLVPALFHDFGYRFQCLLDHTDYVIFNKRPKEFFDNLFLEIGKQVNNMIVIDSIATLAVKLFAFYAWSNNRKNNCKIEDYFEVKGVVQTIK